MQKELDINDLFREAHNRWLKAEEVHFILQNHENHQLRKAPPRRPTSGSLLFYNKRVTRCFRNDGHSWRKKKSTKSVREGHENLKVGNVDALKCYYARGDQDPNFYRRSYWMLDKEYNHIVLVHYRDVTKGNCNTEGVHLSPSCSSASTTRFYASDNRGSLPFCRNGDTSQDSPAYLEENMRLKYLATQKDEMTSNEAERVAPQYVLDSRESHQLPDVYIGLSNYSNGVHFLPGPGGYATRSEEVPPRNVVPEHYTDSCWNDLQDKRFSTLDQIYPNGPGNNTDDMHISQPTFQIDFNSQLSEATSSMPLLVGSDNCMSPNATSLLQALEVSLGAESSSALPQKLKFKINEISPEWGIPTEYTKVIIAGSFLCDPLESTWYCMFGEIEVPVHIIQEGVFCVLAPPHVPGKVTLHITSGNRESCSETREFEYRSKLSTCDNCSPLQRGATKHTDELLLLANLVQILLCDSLVLKKDCIKDIIETLSMGIEIQHSTKDWLLGELLNDKLQYWLRSKYKEGNPSGYILTKEEHAVIHLVAGLGYEWALNPILSCGVNVNHRDSNGRTALHWAALYGREKMVAALIAAGASAGAVTNPTSQDPVGQTPGSFAAASGHKGLAGYLSEVALTNHLLSLTLREREVFNGSIVVDLEKTVESLSKWSISSTDDQLSLKDPLSAYTNSVQTAKHIQSYFIEKSNKRRQEKDAACDENCISLDELAVASKLAFHCNHGKMDNAALSIQKNYRKWKRRDEFLALRQNIVKIQTHVRGYRVRKMYTKILWAVGILEKAVLRWSRKRVGLRGFQGDPNSVDESDYEDILEAFRNLKVYHAVDQALSLVLSMVDSPEAREQYRRMLESYGQVKAGVSVNTNGASTSQVNS